MINSKNMEHRLKQIGAHSGMWGRAEVRELAHILFDDEVLEHCVNGVYEGGFALLAATDQRVLLIDKKPLSYLTVEDIRFDMIAEIDFNHRLLNSTINIFTPNKTLRFTGFNQTRLRNLFNFAQQRVMLIRQHYLNQYQPQQYYGPQAPITLDNAMQYQPMPQTQQTQMQPQTPPPPSSPPPLQAQFSQQTTQQQTQSDQPSQQPQSSPAQSAAPVYAHHMPHLSNMTHGQLSVSAVKRVAPVISAYTRLPLISRQRRFGSYRP